MSGSLETYIMCTIRRAKAFTAQMVSVTVSASMSLVVLGCRQCFQFAIEHRLPCSVDVMHHSSYVGGDTLVQDPTCSRNRAEKETTKRSS
eukprot:15358235-Ditylum_brightwellii.AAC.1